jgi:hypothetical protein
VFLRGRRKRFSKAAHDFTLMASRASFKARSKGADRTLSDSDISPAKAQRRQVRNFVFLTFAP